MSPNFVFCFVERLYLAQEATEIFTQQLLTAIQSSSSGFVLAAIIRHAGTCWINIDKNQRDKLAKQTVKFIKPFNLQTTMQLSYSYKNLGSFNQNILNEASVKAVRKCFAYWKRMEDLVCLVFVFLLLLVFHFSF